MASNKILSASIVLVVVSTFLFSQERSGREFRRFGIHNGNLVRTVFGNWGVVAQPGDKGPRGSWIHDNNGYIGDVSPLVGAQITTLDTSGNEVTFHSVVTCPIQRPWECPEENPVTGTPWTFEPLAGYINEAQERVAMSTDAASWPPTWPDKGTDPDDPGWPGSWNGFFGKDVQYIQQESYYLMNDKHDEEFNYVQNNAWNVEFNPDSTDSGANGLGLRVKVRGMQWQQFLAQDCLFWLYEITNTSTTDYSKVVFGMLVGTYVGVTGTDDRPQEYDDDWSFFDVNQDITYTGDFDNNTSRNPSWSGPVGMVGYAFLESPGNSFDGIDNDGDFDNYPMSAYAPLFQEDSFDSTVIDVDDIVILIDKNYGRSEYKIPTEDTVIVQTRGTAVTILPGVTKLSEGNVLLLQGFETVNPNAYDGIDNDLDGLIDENYFLHYRQRRVDQEGNILFDILNPRAYVDYLNGVGLTNTMIDERRDDGIDNDGDWNAEFDDVGADGIADSYDTGEGDEVPTAGEPNFDQTDVDESDQIGLTSFDYFVPANRFPMCNDEALWGKLAPGFFDVPSTIIEGRPIAGEDGDFIYGTGYFPLRAGQTERFSLALVYGLDLPDMLRNKRTVQKIYDSDYRFPPPPEKPTLKAVPGDGKITLYWDRKAETTIDPVLKILDFQGYKIYRATDPNFNDVRNITDANGLIVGYQPIAQFDLDDDFDGLFYPSADLFQDAQGYTYSLGTNSGLVHSYVDRDVVNGRTYYYAVVAYDTGDEGADVFPSENTKFISILPTGEIITDQNTAIVTPSAKSAGYSIVETVGEEQIVILADLDNSNRSLAPETVTLEHEDIVEHSFHSTLDVVLDVTMGTVTIPAGTKGNYDVNHDGILDGFMFTVSYDYYVPNTVQLADTTKFGIATGSIAYRIIDESSLTGHTYRVEFLDTSTDGVDNDRDWDSQTDDVGSDGTPGTLDSDGTEGNEIPDPGEPNVDFLDLDEFAPITTVYSARDLMPVSESFTPLDTLRVQLEHRNLIPGTVSLVNSLGIMIPEDQYVLDHENGRIRGTQAGGLGSDEHILTFEYYPVYRSPYIQKSPWVDESLDSEIFDGISLRFENDWKVQPVDSLTYWWTNEQGTWEKNSDSTFGFSVTSFDVDYEGDGIIDLYAAKMPNDYMVVFSENPEFGQAMDVNTFPDTLPGQSTNFKVFDMTNGIEVPFYFLEIDWDGQIDDKEIIFFYERDNRGIFHWTWNIYFHYRQSQVEGKPDLSFGAGDTLFLATQKPFRTGDIFTFETPVPEVNKVVAKSQLDNIRVVPNPYVAATKFESPLPPGITSGRGERKVEFQNLPSDAKVHIFTSRGQHIRTLNHNRDIHTGTVTWDLKTRENLDVAFGVYFYVVDSPTVGQKSGKLALIK